MNAIYSLIGPAVVAAVISGLVAVVSMWFSSRTTRALHEEKLAFEREQIERKVNADIALAERKLALDRALADWKRRTELAEQVLSDFYKARDLFIAARRPFSIGGEGSSRTREEDESESDANHLDAVYAPFERLSKNSAFLSELHARRYRLMALFGAEAAKPFELLLSAYIDVRNATWILIEDYKGHDKGQYLPESMEQEAKAVIGWGAEDPIKPIVDEAVTKIETICRSVLETKPT